MHHLCLVTQRHVALGDFREHILQTMSDLPFHHDEGFLDAFAQRVMDRYESVQSTTLLELPPDLLDRPNRTRTFYRQLFTPDGRNVTTAFRTEASEILAEWVEESFGEALLTHRGAPHNNDPAFDVLSLIDEHGVIRLRVIQVKATQDNLQNNCNTALTKFERLERGHHDAELTAQLALLTRLREAPTGLRVRELLFERRYRVAVVHGEDRAALNVMTTFSEKIPGDSSRRSSVFMRVHWDAFWEKLGRRIYAQLSP
jgi:hypothetical protein